MPNSLNLGFSLVDYAIFGIMLVISFGIGVYHAFISSKSKEDFVMGSRNFGIIPMAISLCASFNSAYMILGIPGEIYSYGTQFFIMIFGTGLGVVVAAELWLPILYRLHVVSIYEYFELRYNSKFPRILMTLIFVLKTMLYVSIVVYAPTIALSSVTNLSWWLCILLLGLCATIYTTLGGLKAIVWTDVFQIFIMYGGILAIVIQGLNQTGGFENVWRLAEESNRIEFFNTSFNPYVRHTFINVLFGTFILWGGPYTTSQYLIHRALCLPTIFQGRMSLYLNFVGQFIMVTLVGIVGLILYAFYKDCDPVLAGVVAKRDAVVPLFVLQQFTEKAPGVCGIFISCLFSGALSTLDSALHALASVTWEEIKGFDRFQGVSDTKEAFIIRGLSVIFGIIATGMAFLCNNLGNLINAGGVLFGACMGPMLGYTLVSILVPFVNLKGSCFGLIVGQVINIWLSFGSVWYRQAPPTLPLQATNCSMFGMDEMPGLNTTTSSEFQLPGVDRPLEFSDIYRMSYNIYPIIGMLLTIILSIVGSLTTLSDSDEINEEFVHPIAMRLFRYKPKKSSSEEYILKEKRPSEGSILNSPLKV